MPEMKNQFTGGKMNKDVDERLVPKGEYRDAMNIQVSTSEGSEVGTVQNILGNELVPGIYVHSSAKVVGTIADEKNDAFYWFVREDDGCVVLPNRDLIIERKNNVTRVVFSDIKCMEGNAYLCDDGNINVTSMPSGDYLEIGDTLIFPSVDTSVYTMLGDGTGCGAGGSTGTGTGGGVPSGGNPSL